jgi:N-acetylneuraminic acid mutarotase
VPSAIGYKNEFYVGGSVFPKTDLIKYTPATDQWTTLNPFPENLNGCRFFEYNNLLYCFNGNTSDTTNPTGRVWVYDKGLDSWTQTSFSPCPIPVEIPGLAVHGNRVHLFGGLLERSPLTVHTDEHQIYNFVDGWL